MPESAPDPPLPVIGLGASAGGLEALREFFKHMPDDTGAAFVVVTHQRTGSASALPELLARHTRMAVVELDRDAAIEPDHVYLAAPGRDLSVTDGALRTSLRSDAAPASLAIDHFFRSLARDLEDRAIGIVLSGAGSDGTLGLKEIAAHGGMVMVQSEASARYAGMPRSVLAHLNVDYALPADELPAKLVGYLRQLAQRSRPSPSPAPDSEDFRRIFAVLHSRTSHDFSLYKESTMRRRIERRMNVHHLETFGEYVTLLLAQPEEAEKLFQELLIGVTSFFRDPESYEVLRGLLRDHLRDKPADFVVRVWVNGCSTGEEAYSLAMLLTEIGDELQRRLEMKIFATDLDPEAIEVARGAAYPRGLVLDLTPERVKRFFVEDDGVYRIHKTLREKVVFATQSMITDPPFTRLDLVACRNVLIYLKANLQKRLLPVFHYALREGGLLFLGPSESVTGLEHLFEPADRKWKVFRRREPDGVAIPRLPTSPVGELDRGRGPIGLGARRRAPPTSALERVLLREVVPPSVIVDRQGSVVHVHGRTGMFLEPSPGPKEEANLFEMAREGLGTELAIALRRADEVEGEPHYRRARVRSNGGWYTVWLRVQKLTPAGAHKGLFVVGFERLAPLDPPAEQALTGDDQNVRFADMEAELRSSRAIHQETAEELETTNEELKSANEELQSTNEELQSTNEELETSKEELQSLNEELQTVNVELQSKVEELSRANDDMRNLLDSTGIATIFLDRDLNIKRYTERAKKVVRLISSDIGRPIADLASQLEIDRELVEDAREVLETLVFKEAEIRSRDGRWYLMRILPYRTTENVIDGLVMTFVELTGLETAQGEQRRLLEALQTSPSSVFGQDRELRYTWVCAGIFGVPADEVVGRTDAELLSEEAAGSLTVIKRRVLESGHRERARLRLEIGGTQRVHDIFLEPTRDLDGTIVGLTGVLTVLDES